MSIDPFRRRYLLRHSPVLFTLAVTGTNGQTAINHKRAKTPESAWLAHLAEAKDAERRLHRACDLWTRTFLAGRPTEDAAKIIAECYRAFYSRCRRLTECTQGRAAIVFAATGARPSTRILSAGSFESEEKKAWSYVVWRSGQFLYVTQWERSRYWRCYIAPGGSVWFLVRTGAISASSQLPTLGNRPLVIMPGSWDDAQAKTLITLRYSLGSRTGVISLRRTGETWSIEPDRGSPDEGHDTN
jgi:hypothetical protein